MTMSRQTFGWGVLFLAVQTALVVGGVYWMGRGDDKIAMIDAVAAVAKASSDQTFALSAKVEQEYLRKETWQQNVAEQTRVQEVAAQAQRDLVDRIDKLQDTVGQALLALEGLKGQVDVGNANIDFVRTAQEALARRMDERDKP